jgi:hypothetical protein
MRAITCLLLLCVPSLAGGCATAAVATAGTMVGLAASAISTGSDVYRLGKLDSADLATRDDWLAAVRAAAADLSLTIESESQTEKGNWRATLADARNQRLRVYVEARTKTLIHTRIDVGLLGSEPTARLLLARIRNHCTPATQPTTAATRP